MTQTKKGVQLLRPDALQLSLQTTIKGLNDKINDIKIMTNKPLLTSGMFKFATQQQSDGINIRKLSNIEMLLKILGFLITKKNEYDTAAKMLGLKTYPVFEWGGFTFEAWKNDIEIQVVTITKTNELETLNTTVKELTQHLSSDTRILAALKAAKDLL